MPKKKGVVKQWKTLFEEDREGNQLAFVETLRDQHLSDRAVRLPHLPHASPVDCATCARRISRNCGLWSCG